MEYNSSLVGWGGPLPESRDNTSVEEVLKAVRINTLEQVGLELYHKHKPNNQKGNFLHFFGNFATLKILSVFLHVSLTRWAFQLACGSYQGVGQDQLVLI